MFRRETDVKDKYSIKKEVKMIGFQIGQEKKRDCQLPKKRRLSRN